MARARRCHILTALLLAMGLYAPTFLQGLMAATPEPAFKGDKPSHPIMDSGCTELMEAAYRGDTLKVKEAVEKGADVDAADAYGWTAVRYAVRNRQIESVKMLLELGADINKASKTGRTPLMSAAGNGLEEMCALLVEQGDADIMVKFQDFFGFFGMESISC
eukprot:symbB.v1.2.001300.t1/scaffold57.1/size370615/9